MNIFNVFKFLITILSAICNKYQTLHTSESGVLNAMGNAMGNAVGNAVGKVMVNAIEKMPNAITKIPIEEISKSIKEHPLKWALGAGGVTLTTYELTKLAKLYKCNKKCEVKLEKETYRMPLPLIAFNKGNNKFIKYVIENKGKIDDTDRYGNSVLLYACIEKNNKIARFLVDNGANVEKKNKKGVSPLKYVVCHGNKELTEYFINHSNNIKDKKIKNTINKLLHK